MKAFACIMLALFNSIVITLVAAAFIKDPGLYTLVSFCAGVPNGFLCFMLWLKWSR